METRWKNQFGQTKIQTPKRHNKEIPGPPGGGDFSPQWVEIPISKDLTCPRIRRLSSKDLTPREIVWCKLLKLFVHIAGLKFAPRVDDW